MGPFEMVVAIVAICAVASIIRAKNGIGRRRIRGKRGWEEYRLNEDDATPRGHARFG